MLVAAARPHVRPVCESGFKLTARPREEDEVFAGPNSLSEERDVRECIISAMDQQIRFCTAKDGVRLAYATAGTGYPHVKVANWLSHLEYDLESPVWGHLFQALAAEHALVRYDERGTGLSDRDVVSMSFADWVTDLETVVDAARLERFDVLGISQGGPAALAYAARHPERVRNLILYGTFATFP